MALQLTAYAAPTVAGAPRESADNATLLRRINELQARVHQHIGYNYVDGKYGRGFAERKEDFFHAGCIGAAGSHVYVRPYSAEASGRKDVLVLDAALNEVAAFDLEEQTVALTGKLWGNDLFTQAQPGHTWVDAGSNTNWAEITFEVQVAWVFSATGLQRYQAITADGCFHQAYRSTATRLVYPVPGPDAYGREHKPGFIATWNADGTFQGTTLLQSHAAFLALADDAQADATYLLPPDFARGLRNWTIRPSLGAIDNFVYASEEFRAPASEWSTTDYTYLSLSEFNAWVSTGEALSPMWQRKAPDYSGHVIAGQDIGLCIYGTSKELLLESGYAPYPSTEFFAFTKIKEDYVVGAVVSLSPTVYGWGFSPAGALTMRDWKLYLADGQIFDVSALEDADLNADHVPADPAAFEAAYVSESLVDGFEVPLGETDFVAFKPTTHNTLDLDGGAVYRRGVQTEWRIATDGGKVSLGTPDGGVAVPALNAWVRTDLWDSPCWLRQARHALWWLLRCFTVNAKIQITDAYAPRLLVRSGSPGTLTARANGETAMYIYRSPVRQYEEGDRWPPGFQGVWGLAASPHADWDFALLGSESYFPLPNRFYVDGEAYGAFQARDPRVGEYERSIHEMAFGDHVLSNDGKYYEAIKSAPQPWYTPRPMPQTDPEHWRLAADGYDGTFPRLLEDWSYVPAGGTETQSNWNTPQTFALDFNEVATLVRLLQDKIIYGAL